MWGVREEGLEEGGWYWGLKTIGRQAEPGYQRITMSDESNGRCQRKPGHWACFYAQRIAGKKESPEPTFPLRFDKTAFFSFEIHGFLLDCCIETVSFFTEECPGLTVSEGWVCRSGTPFHSSVGFSKLSLIAGSFLSKEPERVEGKGVRQLVS